MTVRWYQSTQIAFDGTKNLVLRKRLLKSKYNQIFEGDANIVDGYGSDQTGRGDIYRHTSSIQRRADDKQPDQPSPTDRRPLPSLPPEVVHCIDLKCRPHIDALKEAQKKLMDPILSWKERNKAGQPMSPYLWPFYRNHVYKAQETTRNYVKAVTNHGIFMKAQHQGLDPKQNDANGQILDKSNIKKRAVEQHHHSSQIGQHPLPFLPPDIVRCIDSKCRKKIKELEETENIKMESALVWEDYLIGPPKMEKKGSREARRERLRKAGLAGNMRVGANYIFGLQRARDAIRQRAKAVTNYGIIMKALSGQKGQRHDKSIIEKRAVERHEEQNKLSQKNQRPLPSLPPEVLHCIDSKYREYIKTVQESHEKAMNWVLSFEDLFLKYVPLCDLKARRRLWRKATLENKARLSFASYKKELQYAQKVIKEHADAVTNHSILMKALGRHIHALKLNDQGIQDHRSNIETRTIDIPRQLVHPSRASQRLLPSLPPEIIHCIGSKCQVRIDELKRGQIEAGKNYRNRKGQNAFWWSTLQKANFMRLSPLAYTTIGAIAEKQANFYVQAKEITKRAIQSHANTVTNYGRFMKAAETRGLDHWKQGQEKRDHQWQNIEKRAVDGHHQPDRPNQHGQPSKTDLRPWPYLPPEVVSCVSSKCRKCIDELKEDERKVRFSSWVNRMKYELCLRKVRRDYYRFPMNLMMGFRSPQARNQMRLDEERLGRLRDEFDQGVAKSKQAVKTWAKAVTNHGLFMKAQAENLHGAKQNDRKDQNPHSPRIERRATVGDKNNQRPLPYLPPEVVHHISSKARKHIDWLKRAHMNSVREMERVESTSYALSNESQLRSMRGWNHLGRTAKALTARRWTHCQRVTSLKCPMPIHSQYKQVLWNAQKAVKEYAKVIENHGLFLKKFGPN